MVCSMINDNLAPPSAPWQHRSSLSEMLRVQCDSSKAYFVVVPDSYLVIAVKLAFLHVLFCCF